VIKVQEVWDSKGMSIDLQDYMLKELFGHLRNSDNSVELEYQDGLGALLRKMPPHWTGSIEGPSSTPSSFRHLIGLYKRWGLVEPNRWRMCLGTKDYGHEPLILPPTEEDTYDGSKFIQCSCLPPANKRTCVNCAVRCTQCGKTRLEMIAFDYLPISNQLSSVKESGTLYYEMLTMWRNRQRWLTTNVTPERISQFWDGENVREYQDFWNP